MNAPAPTPGLLRSVLVGEGAPGVIALQQLLRTQCPELRVIATASTIASALAITRSGEADVLFIDIDLPDGSGIDVAEAELGFDTMVVLLSTNDMEAELRARFSTAFFLTKPISLEELRAIISEIVSRNR